MLARRSRSTFAHPLQSRKLFLNRHRARLGDDDVNLRLFMTQYVGGTGEAKQPGAAFARGLARFDVTGVLLRNSGSALEARDVLTRLQFERKLHAIDHEIWVRKPRNGAGRTADGAAGAGR